MYDWGEYGRWTHKRNMYTPRNMHAYTVFPQNTKDKMIGDNFVHAQSCLSLCNPMNCSLPVSSVHGIILARTLEWVAISFSREPSWPSNSCGSCIGRGVLCHWATWEAPEITAAWSNQPNCMSFGFQEDELWGCPQQEHCNIWTEDWKKRFCLHFQSSEGSQECGAWGRVYRFF